ncbi:hypothetical protein BCU68_06070 [Vibrio sp. 10N.286.49.B3]|uniref:hypothetical protein n=1 Tax=Vibrio sp. 10N.286.49.B3 TaxID=1880855 RepID=UPI000C819FF2|nr:hypothetical protein [Vibrio sp. 10N.286.49.B3]PMH41243.1 hypothetical protein BCU68_06070 [Vibrio sp. 10N.286.49.B3]
MWTQIKPILLMLAILSLLGCAHNNAKLGHHVANMRAQQTYDLTATQDNVDVIPTGSGERMEGAYHTYTGKSDSELNGSDSQFLEGFAQ